jgi:hypothetical protein
MNLNDRAFIFWLLSSCDFDSELQDLKACEVPTARRTSREHSARMPSKARPLMWKRSGFIRLSAGGDRQRAAG